MRRWLWYQDLVSPAFTEAHLTTLLATMGGKFTDLMVAPNWAPGWTYSWFPSTLMRIRSERIDGLLPGAWLVQEAAKIGVAVHVWMVVGQFYGYSQLFNPPPSSWNTATLPAPCNAAAWLDFSIPDARQMVANVAGDWLAQCPGLAGVNLDYIRVHHLMMDCARITSAHITDTVARVQAVAGGREVSACALGTPSPPWNIANCKQDCHTWLNNGLVDWLMMMRYDQLAAKLSYMLTLPHQEKIVAGVSLEDTMDVLWPEQLAFWLARGYDKLAVFDGRPRLFTADVVATLPDLVVEPPPPPPPPTGASKYRITGVHKFAGADLLHVDVEFYEDGKVQHYNDFLMQIVPGQDVLAVVQENIRAYAARRKVGDSKLPFDARGRFKLEVTDSPATALVGQDVELP